jgi:hypothetical protein
MRWIRETHEPSEEMVAATAEILGVAADDLHAVLVATVVQGVANLSLHQMVARGGDPVERFEANLRAVEGGLFTPAVPADDSPP